MMISGLYNESLLAQMQYDRFLQGQMQSMQNHLAGSAIAYAGRVNTLEPEKSPEKLNKSKKLLLLTRKP
jgi:hypothetical protein